MQLEKLWSLQEQDLSIRALTEKLASTPLRQEVEEAGVRVEELTHELASREETLKEQRKNLKSIEMDLQQNSDYRKELKNSLYGGRVSNVKELEQMEKKLTSMEKEARLREEEALSLMEQVEEGEEQLKEARRRAGEAESMLSDARQRLEAETTALEEELKTLNSRREALVEQIEPKLLQKYDTLSQKHQGRPLARVNNDICGGCRVFISSAMRGNLFNRDSLVNCENCGRLLLKGD